MKPSDDRRVRSKVRGQVVATLVAAGLVIAACGEASEPAAEGAMGPKTETGVAAWGRVLAAHARDGGIDYAALAADRGDLDAFLEGLAGPPPAGEAAQMAFWINAYNAVVAHFVLERYPGIRSVREVDGFFDRLRFPVGGEELTLDEVEGRARDLGDPRVHFAVVCASTSCPDLRGEPYVAARVAEQLEEDTRRFLADESKGLRLDREADALWLSSIFKWYAGDFTGGSTAVAFILRGRVVEWLLPHLPAPLAAEIGERKPAVRYLDYDWSLNDRPSS